MGLRRTVLVRKSSEKHADGHWYSHWFVARDNPLTETPFLHEARNFDTMALARTAKRALWLDRTLRARTLPEWLS